MYNVKYPKINGSTRVKQIVNTRCEYHVEREYRVIFLYNLFVCPRFPAGTTWQQRYLNRAIHAT